MKKLTSLTIFFPFLNDEGTVEKAISDAYYYGKKVASDLEVIAIHGGKSKDKTFEKIKNQKGKHKDLIIVDKRDNKEGYAVIKEGFKKATKNWVFYTDGDLQYHLDELGKLVLEQEKTEADVVNGYKTGRNDPLDRVILGLIYKNFSRFLFNSPVKDIDCDFRLIRRTYLSKIELNSNDSSVLPEMIVKLNRAGAKFSEIPVKHYERTWGKSNYNGLNLVIEKLRGDISLRLGL